MRGCPPFLRSSALSPICRGSYIGRLQRGEVQNGEVQRYRNAGDAEIPEMGGGAESPLPIFLMLRGSSALLYGLFRELLQVFGGSFEGF